MKLRGYIEGVILVVVMWFVFQGIVQPILVGIDPMFADQSVDRVRRGPQTPAQVAGIITFVLGLFIYYSGRFMNKHSPLLYFANVAALFFLIIPNNLLPEKYHPENFHPDDVKKRQRND